MSKGYFDLGNTSLKVFDSKGELLGTFSCLEDSWVEDLVRASKGWPFTDVVVASVAVPKKLALIIDSLPEINFERAASNKGQWTVMHCYKDPSKLGIDRLLAIEAAYREVRGSLVVIDCGSAITIDAVSAEGQHLGGYIVPGFRLQMRSLLDGTNLRFAEDDPGLALGCSTTECIRHGSLRMIHAFCQSVIDEINPERVFITGGDIKGVLNSLSVFGEQDDLLVFKGLKSVYA